MMSVEFCDIVHVDDDEIIRQRIEAAFPEYSYQGADNMIEFSHLVSNFIPKVALIVDGVFKRFQDSRWPEVLCYEALMQAEHCQKLLLPKSELAPRFLLTSKPKDPLINRPELLEELNCSIVSKEDGYIDLIRNVINSEE